LKSVLDLGCGTGLAGLELKSFCKNIEGIDLSKKMLAQARKKNIYNKLSHIGILEYLADAPLDFDLFLSLDVFIYVGDLSEVFRLIKSRNKQKGQLAFSTEHKEKDGFSLETSGRYSHSKSYIESLCEEFNYQVLHFSKTNLRKDKGTFLTGGLYLLEF
jgi:predicted TPR repeat methyltransferase